MDFIPVPAWDERCVRNVRTLSFASCSVHSLLITRLQVPKAVDGDAGKKKGKATEDDEDDEVKFIFILYFNTLAYRNNHLTGPKTFNVVRKQIIAV